jgi:hypothetical protein
MRNTAYEVQDVGYEGIRFELKYSVSQEARGSKYVAKEKRRRPFAFKGHAMPWLKAAKRKFFRTHPGVSGLDRCSQI